MSRNATIAYFGYGSLVNLRTLQTPYISAHPARLHGWRREWLCRPMVGGSFAPIENLAFLSARPSADCVIDGMVVLDHASSLAALDEREALYERLTIDARTIEYTDTMPPPDHGRPIYVYKALAPEPAHQGSRILRSYLDAVLQGFRHHHGEAALRRFVETTDYGETPIHEDRDKPIYPRPVSLGADEAALFDKLLPAIS